MEGLEFGGLSPWVLLAASGSLVARVRYGSSPADRRRAARAARPAPDASVTDDPAEGSFRTWTSRSTACCWPPWARGPRATAPWTQRDDGVRLVAIADRWAYNRSFPVMAWASLRELTERSSPGRLDEVVAEYADRPAADLVEEARAMLRRVATSSG